MTDKPKKQILFYIIGIRGGDIYSRFFQPETVLRKASLCFTASHLPHISIMLLSSHLCVRRKWLVISYSQTLLTMQWQYIIVSQ